MNRFGIGEPITFEVAFDRTRFAMENFLRATSGGEKRKWRRMSHAALLLTTSEFEKKFNIQPFEVGQPIGVTAYLSSSLTARAPYIVREYLHPTDRSLDCHGVDERRQDVTLLYHGIDARSFYIDPENDGLNGTTLSDVFIVGYDISTLPDSSKLRQRGSTFCYVPLNDVVIRDKLIV
jgi:hypothetical protein